MIETLQGLDLEALLWFNGFHTPGLDAFAMVVTNRFTWIPLYIVLAYLLFRRVGWRQGLAWLVGIGVMIAMVDQTCSALLRPLFERLRPSNLMNPDSALVTVVNGYRGGRFGFPSCHAANCMALTILFSLFYKRWWMTMLLIAYLMLNCWSRMYLGVHYPGDILFGLTVGALMGWGMYELLSRVVIPRIQRRSER